MLNFCWVDNDVPNWFLPLKNFYWLPFSKWPPQYHTNSTLFDFSEISYNVEFLLPIFYVVFWQSFWKSQTSWKFGKCRIAPQMVTYHCVKIYVSIINHLEVININVRNFNFPIGFYSKPHPLWTPPKYDLNPLWLQFVGRGRHTFLRAKTNFNYYYSPPSFLCDMNVSTARSQELLDRIK
jgi:hypothetical protein